MTTPPSPRITVIMNEEHCPLDRFAGWLEPIEFDIRRPYVGDAIPDEPGAGLIVLGGTMNAVSDDENPWLVKTRALLRSATEAQIPTLGICLGAQLLGVALGGELEVGAAAGPERGALQLILTEDAPADPIFGSIDAGLVVATMHQDVVSALPPNSTLLARSERYANQVFRVGAAAWGVQFHPEVSLDLFAEWARTNPQLSKSAATAVVESVRSQYGEIEHSARTIAARFAKVVLDSATHPSDAALA